MMKEGECGIYRLKNTQNGKVYIGQSCDIARRYREHLKLLRKSKHYNARLQNAWTKYGEAAFVVEVVFLCDRGDLDACEFDQIKLHKSADEEFGYNLCYEPGNGNRRGLKNSAEHRAAISKAKKGRPGPLHTEDSRAAIRKALTGKEKSPEHRAALALALTGNVAPNLGIPHSNEVRQKMRAAKATIEWEGEMVSLTTLANKVGILRETIAHRLRMGMSLEEAVSTPLHSLRKKDPSGRFTG